jgi:hypothetical protein
MKLDAYLEEPGVQLGLQTLLADTTTTSTVLFEQTTGDCTAVHATVLVKLSEKCVAT